MIYSDIQAVLDATLYPEVLSYWLRKSGTDANEYIVYTIDSDEAINADDRPLIRNANIAVRYYFKDSLLSTSSGRTKVQNRAEAIIVALEESEYTIPYGAQNIGDIDDIGYGVLLIECYKERVV